MRVLVLGAGGYVGGAVAAALARRGHRVVGVVRNAAQAAAAAANEVEPVIGVVSFDGSAGALDLRPLIAAAEVVIDTLNHKAPQPGAGNRATLELVAEASRASNAASGKKRYIYTSSLLLHAADDADAMRVFSEADEPNNAGGAWRTALERDVLGTTTSSASKDVEGVVVRPGWVYGGHSGKFISSWYAPADGAASPNAVVIAGSAAKRWGWIHIDDLADAYVRIAEAGRRVVAHQVFDVCDATVATYGEVRCAMLAAGAKARGTPLAEPPVIVQQPRGDDAWSVYSDVSCLASTDKIERLLGWRPRHRTFLEHVDTAARAYVAASGGGVPVASAADSTTTTTGTAAAAAAAAPKSS